MNLKLLCKKAFGFKKTIISLLIICAVATPIIVTTINAHKYPLFFSVGSSSVKPILDDFAKIYTKNHHFDLIVDGGGSATGIQDIANGKTNIGNTSRSPQTEAENDFKEKWINKNLKTITIAWDGIAIIYKQPKNAKEELNIDKDNIEKLYEAMTGVYEGENKTLDDITIGSGDVEIVAYPRTGGSNRSGTAEAFANNSNLINKIDNQVKMALKDGSYNFKRKIFPTEESNAQTWRRVSSDNIEGAITYLSTGFVLNNLDIIKNKGFKIATYNKIEFNYDNLAVNYSWVRPINCIVSLNEISQALKSFFEWLLISKELDEDKFKQIGVKKLNNNQINSMCDENDWNNFWSIKSTDHNLGYYGAQNYE